MLSNSNEPVYQGRKLGSWLRGHPREYYPAVLATGTNALPYLLAEIQATDSSLSEWGQGMLGKASIGPPWRTARERRYHARLGLQILDTNSVIVLLEQVFATPMRIAENDPSYAAASSLTFMGSPTAQTQIIARIDQALQSPDPVERRNGCLTICCWPHTNFALSVAQLTKDTNATVRAAAVRAIIFSKWDTNFLPALVARLNDDEAEVRCLAADALGYRTTNAVAALPALLAAYAAERSRPDARSAIESAIKSIDPKTTLPRSP
jgi:hypothetical protein